MLWLCYDFIGDIDPDRFYFNENSNKKWFKNCNYYMDDFFNKYLQQHNISDNSAFEIGFIYRIPNSNTVKFIETLSDILREISHRPWYIKDD